MGLTVTGAPGSPQSRLQGRAGLLGEATACSAEDGAERGRPEPTVRATLAAPGGQAKMARPRCRRCGC